MSDARRVAASNLSVLITGESGTGKEVFASYIHENSDRANNPFVPVNCSAIPVDLLESTLFGHIKGAFTGATENQDGLFVQADRGTLFLDEIGDMPLALQAKMLRVLEEGKVRPVGSKTEKTVDVRVICATHQNLVQMLKERKFRKDLLYRLNDYQIKLPPLRERAQDVVMLAQFFLGKITKSQWFARDAKAYLLQYHWPGNARELKKVIAATSIDAPRRIEIRHLQKHLVDHTHNQKVETIAERILGAISVKPHSLAELHRALAVPKTTLSRHLRKLESACEICRIKGKYSVANEEAGFKPSQCQSVAVSHQAKNDSQVVAVAKALA